MRSPTLFTGFDDTEWFESMNRVAGILGWAVALGGIKFVFPPPKTGRRRSKLTKAEIQARRKRKERWHPKGRRRKK